MSTASNDLPLVVNQQVMTTEHVLPRPRVRRHALCVAVADSRVREAIETRRVELGMSQDDVARASNISMSTLQRVLRGHDPLPKTARAIERALGWERGSLRDVSQGASARLAAPSDDHEPDEEMSLDELRETVATLAETVDMLRGQLARLESQRSRTSTTRNNRAVR
jgi:transcriptional regulator with XRE-family HTH domain